MCVYLHQKLNSSAQGKLMLPPFSVIAQVRKKIPKQLYSADIRLVLIVSSTVYSLCGHICYIWSLLYTDPNEAMSWFFYQSDNLICC